MDRSTPFVSTLAVFALAGTIALSGCTDSLTGTTPPDADQQVTVEQRADHNVTSNSTDTVPHAGHNTSDED